MRVKLAALLVSTLIGFGAQSVFGCGGGGPPPPMVLNTVVDFDVVVDYTDVVQIENGDETLEVM